MAKKSNQHAKNNKQQQQQKWHATWAKMHSVMHQFPAGGGVGYAGGGGGGVIDEVKIVKLGKLSRFFFSRARGWHLRTAEGNGTF